MTNEQLDEIEAQINEFWEESGFILPLVKAVREARAVARQIERTLDVVTKQRDVAEADNVALRRSLENARNEARAEVDRLRSALRLLWEEATTEDRCATEYAPGCYGHHISKPCREAVGAALKEGG